MKKLAMKFPNYSIKKAMQKLPSHSIRNTFLKTIFECSGDKTFNLEFDLK